MSSEPYVSLHNVNMRQVSSFPSQPYSVSRGPYLSQSDRSRSRSPAIRHTSNVHSETLKKMMDDIYMYPAGFAELLRHEDRNLKTFKLNINKEK